MSSDVLSISASIREGSGTGAARSLRREGRIPAVVYGKGSKEFLVSVPQKEMIALNSKFNRMTTQINLDVDGKSYKVLPKLISVHPVTDAIEHVDFMLLNTSDVLNIKVPLRILGKDKSPGIKRGGVVNLVSRSLLCKVQKASIPDCIDIDVSEMNIGDTLRLENLTLPKGTDLATKDLKQTILKLVGKKALKAEDEEKSAAKEEDSKAAAAKAGPAKPGAAAPAAAAKPAAKSDKK